MLEVVSFDMIGTLLDSSFEDHVWNTMIPKLYARKRAINFEEAKEFTQREYNNVGNRDIRWYLPSYWFKYFNLDEDPLGVFRSHINKVKFYPETLSVVKKLSQKYELIQIILPEFYEPVEDYKWVKTTSVQVFFKFYSKRTK